RFAFLNDFEMVVERRHLVHLGERKAHLLRERREMRRRQVAVVIVKLVQMLDQEIALPRRVAEKLLHVGERLCIDRPAFRDRARFAFHAALLSGSGVRGFLTAVKRLVLLGEPLEDETVEAVGAALVAPAEVPEAARAVRDAPGIARKPGVLVARRALRRATRRGAKAAEVET